MKPEKVAHPITNRTVRIYEKKLKQIYFFPLFSCYFIGELRSEH